VRADLEDITARLGALPGLRDLGITSNGLVLAKKLPGALALARTHASLHSRVADARARPAP
jgi:molybdenum cofactor biosynthesis enzyme MoaA